MPASVPQNRHATPENIRRFFSASTYRKEPAAGSGMGVLDLLEKFKLAAELNGHSREDIAVSRP